MVVNIVINSIVGSELGYKDDDFDVPVLFYADDGLLLATLQDHMRRWKK